MGTRADFYIGRGPNAEWLASIAWDGYPEGIRSTLLQATSEDEYRTQLEDFLASRGDVTRPADGWPWPWNDSRTTDYAYAFDGDKVHASRFGSIWFDPLNEPEGDIEKDAIFPDMSKCKNVTFGRRSGLIVISG